MNNKLLYPIFIALFILTTGMAYKTRELPPAPQTLTITKEAYRDQLPQNHEVLAAFDQFNLELEKAYQQGKGLTESDYQNILEAVLFSSEKHQYQARKNVEKTSYIVHPIRVASHLLTIGKVVQKEVLIAALLHDTLEDTETTYEEISSFFGVQVANFVQEVTNDPLVPSHVQKEQQVLKACHKSAGAAMIKLADKFDNLSDLKTSPPQGWDLKRIDHYFRHAKAVIDNLPWVNAPLKQSVESLISKYWHDHTKS